MILAPLFFLFACLAFLPTPGDEQCAAPAAGLLEISYRFNPANGVEPSYQAAFWLEDENGKYVKSILVAEYLSYGGFNDPTICPDWSKLAGWEESSEEEFDAVTRPTPPVGGHILRIDCKERSIPPGLYSYCVQVHIVENYNVLYKGRIHIGDKADESQADPAFTPERHPEGGDVISDVHARYIPFESIN
jgi:hypothetical protein